MTSKLDKVRNITNHVYKRTIKQIGYSRSSLHSAFYLDEVINEDQYHHAKEVLDSEYLKGLGKLPTFVLDYILHFHSTGELRRAKKTIDFIHKVIAERILLHESKGEN